MDTSAGDHLSVVFWVDRAESHASHRGVVSEGVVWGERALGDTLGG